MRLADLNIKRLIRECSIDYEKAMEEYLNISKAFRYKRGKIVSYWEYLDDMTSTMSVYGDLNNFFGSLNFNFKELQDKLLDFLNVEELSYEKDEFIANCKEKIEQLKNIDNASFLDYYFPNLYNHYMAGYDLLEKLDNIKNGIEDGSESKIKGIEMVYDKCGMSTDEKIYINNQIEKFNLYLDNFDDIKNLYDNFYLKRFIFNYFNQDKVKLFLLNEIFQEVIICSDIEKQIKLKQVLISMINSNRNFDVHIRNSDGVDISFMELRNAVQDYLRDNNIYWKTNSRQESEILGLETSEINDDYHRLNNEKIVFYQSLPFVGEMKGIWTCKGKYAFLLPNGKVIVEKIATKENEMYDAYKEDGFIIDYRIFKALAFLPIEKIKYFDVAQVINHNEYWEQEIIDDYMLSNPIEEELQEEFINNIKTRS